MRWWWIAALTLPAIAACNALFTTTGDVNDAGAGDASAGQDATTSDGSAPSISDGGADSADAIADASIDEASDAGPASCAQARAMTGAMTDGKYTIDVDGTGPIPPFQIYCYEMADPTKTPSEYLSVPSASGQNFSTFAIGGYCTGCTGNFVRQFTRVRLRVPDLTVLTNDFQFATPLTACGNSYCQGTSLEWGMAGSCVTNDDSSGTGNIDLTGTVFHIAASATFVQEGAMPAGSAVISTDRKTVTLTGGGACGWTQAAPAYNYLLTLAHD